MIQLCAEVSEKICKQACRYNRKKNRITTFHGKLKQKLKVKKDFRYYVAQNHAMLLSTRMN